MIYWIVTMPFPQYSTSPINFNNVKTENVPKDKEATNLPLSRVPDVAQLIHS